MVFVPCIIVRFSYHQSLYNGINTIEILRKEIQPMEVSSSERGQGLTEYAFIISLVVIVVIVILVIFGIAVEDLYENTIPILVEIFTA